MNKKISRKIKVYVIEAIYLDIDGDEHALTFEVPESFTTKEIVRKIYDCIETDSTLIKWGVIEEKFFMCRLDLYKFIETADKEPIDSEW